MKKVLYGTTALLAAGMFTIAANAAPASTSAVKLSIGGYMNAWMGYANLDKKKLVSEGLFGTSQGAANQFDIGTDSIISLNAEAKLNNSLRLGAIAELVVASPVDKQDWLKDVYGYADTKYGRVEFGATSNVAKKMHHGAPDVGVFGVNESKLVNWIGIDPLVSLDSVAINFDGNNKKLSYFSPKFYGFQIGLTYTPGDEAHIGYGPFNGATMNSTVMKPDGDKGAFTNAEIASIAYNNKFGGVEVGADFGFGNIKPKAATAYTIDMDDTGTVTGITSETKGHKAVQQYSFGADVGFSGFKIGGAYTWRSSKDTWRKDGLKTGDDKAFEVGASYENGPFGISANYFYSKDGNVKTYVNGEKVKEKNTKFQMFQLSGKYKLGAGVDAFATFGYLKYDNKDFNRSTDLKNTWTIATGLALKF